VLSTDHRMSVAFMLMPAKTSWTFQSAVDTIAHCLVLIMLTLQRYVSLSCMQASVGCRSEAASSAVQRMPKNIPKKFSYFLSRVSILTRDIDIANLSLRPSVMFRNSMETA